MNYQPDMTVSSNRLALLLASALSFGTPAASAQIQFSDVSIAAGVAHQGETYGAAWGDLNGDGYPDIFASNHRTQPSLFLNKGDGTFLDTGNQVAPWVNRQHADTHGGSWADFNNDGHPDLLISTGTGNPSQLLVNEHDALIDRTTQYGVDFSNVGGRLPVWLDYDGDNLLDFVMTQYGGIAKLYKQNADGAGFTETTSAAKLLCKRFHYGQLFDVTNNGRLDFFCSDETLFPQKIYDTLPLPWQKLFDNASPTSVFPTVSKVPDSIIGDFNNDGRMDMFLLSGVQLRPSSVVQGGPNYLEALLTGGIKGFKFISPGAVTFDGDWNKAAEATVTNLAKIQIGASGWHPAAIPFTLDSTDPSVVGMPPAPTLQSDLPVMQIGFDPATSQWTLVIQTKLDSSSPSVFSEAYLMVSAAAPISNLKTTGLWGSDKTGRPTLLMNDSGGFSDQTVAAGLDTPVQCVSVTAGDFDNDMDLDLYLACRTGASNLQNILYENQGDGTFVAVPNAGGAGGPVGVAVASGAGTADSVVSADYDVDGFLDLFVTNGFNLRPLYYGGPNSLFHNQGNGNHWIELDLVGTQSDRDAVGARVYATANGVTQLRVQNGAYHRWSQDSIRSHFGLAGATTVDLRVEWPSGNVETFTGVAANKLYRITENGGIAPVALGVAPAYPCGAPANLNGAVDTGVFIWKDCPSGEWRMKTAAGGGSVVYSGTITSSAAFSSVNPVGLSGGDSVDSTTNPAQIVYQFTTTGSGTDGVNFVPQEGASTCLKVDVPAGAQVYYGPLRTPLAQPFDLDTQTTCVGLPSELSVSPVSVSETAGQAQFTVKLTPAASKTVTVAYATADGSATAGQDYTAVANTLTFTPGVTTRTVAVPILDDALAEGDETFMLSLSNPTNANLSTASQAVGTIVDNEPSPCGAPSYNAGVTAAAFIWRDCSSGEWFARFTSGGSTTTVTYSGSVVAAAPFTSVTPFSLETSDTLDTSNPATIGYTLNMNKSGQDGFNFTLPVGTSACFNVTPPAGASVLVGASMTPVTPPFRLDTLGSCS